MIPYHVTRTASASSTHLDSTRNHLVKSEPVKSPNQAGMPVADVMSSSMAMATTVSVLRRKATHSTAKRASHRQSLVPHGLASGWFWVRGRVIPSAWATNTSTKTWEMRAAGTKPSLSEKAHIGESSVQALSMCS